MVEDETLKQTQRRLLKHTHTPDTRKVKPIWILLKQETVSGSGIIWNICKSAPRSRQITTPAPHHSVFFTGRMPFLLPNQQHQSTEGKSETDSVTSAENRKGKNVCRYLNARERFLISAVESYCNSERLRQFRQ